MSVDWGRPEVIDGHSSRCAKACNSRGFRAIGGAGVDRVNAKSTADTVRQKGGRHVPTGFRSPSLHDSNRRMNETQKPTPLLERLKLGPNSVDVTPDKTGTIFAVVGAESLRPPTANVPAKRSEVGLA
jgi:hypothetical protein